MTLLAVRCPVGADKIADMVFVLLEATHAGFGGVNPFVFGGLALGALIFGLIWVIGMGSGRPNSK